jgi:hypothetical protein
VSLTTLLSAVSSLSDWSVTASHILTHMNHSQINAGLQHSYYCLLSNFKPSTVSLDELVNFVLAIVLPRIPTSSSWNGRMIDLNAKNIGTACWKLLTEDWLPTIRYVHWHLSPQRRQYIVVLTSKFHQYAGFVSAHVWCYWHCGI